MTTFGKGVTGTPRWSPDGSRIVFDAHPGAYSTIYVVATSGGNPRPLTDGKAEDMMPSWSHDGRWIYFVSRRSGDEQIWKMPSNGGAAVQITRQVGREALESPDGRTLYYHGGPERGIWRVPVDDGEESPVPELAPMPPSRYWTVTSRGIYFAPLSTGSREFRFFDFQTRLPGSWNNRSRPDRPARQRHPDDRAPVTANCELVNGGTMDETRTHSVSG
ncbi:MAG: PD40 domain-containing protein [Bryobacterales bacterium]|nr:PD40 domain-containing protein [Bryobacterales bacterium]